MQYVPVVSNTGKPLMPCHAARARQLVRKGRTVLRFNKGIFYIQLLDRADGEVQPITVGVDPGSKREGFTVKSAAHTYLNVQAEAVDWGIGFYNSQTLAYQQTNSGERDGSHE